MERFDLRNADCLEVMRNLDDKSQHLIIADPPYFEVKGEFDFIWPDFDSYLKDVETWAQEIKRILADNGTLFWWGHAKKIAYTQIILDRYFTLCNSLVWKKVECQTRAQSFESSRTFAPVTERILMYSNEYEPSDWNKTGTERILEEHIAPKNPYSLVMKKNMLDKGFTQLDISKLQLSKNGNLTGWVHNKLSGVQCPTEVQWGLICKLFSIPNEYEELRNEYEELRNEYEELRRPFNNTLKLEDVLEFSQEGSITGRYKHPTQKPPKLCRALIQTCSKSGQNMFIPFGGSGVEMIEGYKLRLNVVGSELSTDYCELIKNRFTEETRQLSLF